MKIEIEIDDTELEQMVIQRLADIVIREYTGQHRRFVLDMKEIMRQMLKENKDYMVEKAIDYAGEYIGNRGVKKIIEGLK